MDSRTSKPKTSRFLILRVFRLFLSGSSLPLELQTVKQRLLPQALETLSAKLGLVNPELRGRKMVSGLLLIAVL